MKVIKNNFSMLKLVMEASKFRILFAFLSAILNSILPLLNILIVKIVMDMVTSDKKVVDLIKFLLIMLFAYAAIVIYDAWYNQKYCVHSDLYIKQHIQKKVYSKIQNIDMEAFDKPDFYSSYTKAVKETSSRAITVLNTIINLIRSILSFLGIVSIMVWLDPIVILIVLGSVVISILISNMQNKKAYAYDMAQVENNRMVDYVGRVFYLQQFAKEIKIFRLYDYFIRKYNNTMGELHKTREKFENKITLLNFLQNLIQISVVLIIIFFLGLKMLAKVITVGSFAGLLNASQELGNSIQQIFTFIPNMVQNSLYIDNINIFIDYEAVIELQNKGMILKPGEHKIEIKDVSFKYTKNSPYVLKDICFSINHGETVAIVGYNGSGKSTLIKNILRLYDPSSGSIILDGHDYKEYDVNSLRSRIGVVFQDFQCFATTIADNILLRPVKTEEDEELVWKALRMSGLEEKVRSLENTIYTILTKEFDENGIMLSGGEMQKLALARIFARDCDIIILDEPSSALDSISEYNLNNSIMKIAKHKTLIIISHRLSTTREANHIIYMEDGRIKEAGNHKELMDLNGKYAYLYNLQAEKYKEKD